MDFCNIEEGTVYEVIVSTCNDDGTFDVKPFGMVVSGGMIVLRLYPNNTLLNIRRTCCFDVHFTSDVLLYTWAALGLLDGDELGVMDLSVHCEVNDFCMDNVVDDYGENITTTIIAKPIKIIKNNESIPLINRATSKIIEVLVDLSRYQYMDTYSQKKFHKKIDKTDKFIQKTGNKKHKKAIKEIKKRIQN